MLHRGLLSAALLLAGMGVAHAGAYSVSAAYGPDLTEIMAELLTLAPFDTTRGTLTGVTLELETTGRLSGTVTNTSRTAQTMKMSESLVFTLSGPAAIAGLGGLTTTLTEATSVTVPSGANADFGPFDLAGTKVVNPGPLPLFSIGPLDFILNTETTTGTSGGGGNLISSFVTLAGGTLTATYTYDAAITEPASLALLGAGLLGAIAIRRHTTRQRAGV